MCKYSITDFDRKKQTQKVANQKSFLSLFNLKLGDGDFNLLENVYSANVNPKKYSAEVSNRVNSIDKFARKRGLKPVFLTLTLGSEWHKKTKSGKLVNSPNDAAKHLTKLWVDSLRCK